MGTYADELIEREIREGGERIMREELRKADLHRASGMAGGPADPNATGRTLVRTHEALDLRALINFCQEPDDPLTVHMPSPHHVQVRTADGKVFAEWWPSKGTTMMDQQRGPRCRTAEDVVAWLRQA
jgi:hypothetical protein